MRIPAALLLLLLAAWFTRPAPPAGPLDPEVPPAAPRAAHEVTIHNRLAQPGVATDVLDMFGRPALVSCAMCHQTRTPDAGNGRAPGDLDEFHQGIVFAHGDLSCLACHNRADYDTLALADGTALPYGDAIRLCAQCHGPQYRDYRNGSHGGMSGYWDLTRGPRLRNHCVDCHDAHAPAIGPVFPVLLPNDRFLVAPATTREDAHE